MTAFVFILFLRIGYAGGVVAVQMPDLEACQAAQAEAKKVYSYQDSICIRQH